MHNIIIVDKLRCKDDKTYCFTTVNSTLRLSLRVASDLLDAIGFEPPYPFPVSLLDSIPLSIK